MSNYRKTDNNKHGNSNNSGKPRRRPNSRKPREKEDKDTGTMLDPEGRNNNPNWYFLDSKVADQVSQLSFQQLGDMPVRLTGAIANPQTGVVTPSTVSVDALSIVSVLMNPSPGVQLKSNVGQSANLQKSAINLAGFRLFTKLAAFTGRKQDYAPQDISTLILYFGEIITQIEWMRRAFGVCYTMNMQNRAFPMRLLRAMTIDAGDMFANYANYRTQFNKIVTRMNQIPIPKDIAYFDKCASLYEKIYLDSESPMATIIMHNPATSWNLNEQLSDQGSVLRTISWCGGVSGSMINAEQKMKYFLDKCESCIDQLMGSTTYNVVYTDLLNFAAKTGMQFWKFDYLLDGYIVYPEYNVNELLMLHNATVAHQPNLDTNLTAESGITPYNDVWPDVNGNALYYNPAIPWVGDTDHGAYPSIPHFQMIVDSISPDPKVEDRIEMLKFSSMGAGTYKSKDLNFSTDCVLSDHYVCNLVVFSSDGIDISQTQTSFLSTAVVDLRFLKLSQWDWGPIMYTHDKDNVLRNFRPFILGDLNYYTAIDSDYLRKIVDFTGLALYDMRFGDK